MQRILCLEEPKSAHCNKNSATVSTLAPTPIMLLAVLGLFAWTASSADAAHQSDDTQRDFSSSLSVAPNTLTLNQPTSDQLAGHCGGGYYGRPSYNRGYYAPRYHAYRPAYYGSYGSYGYPGNYGDHHHHYRRHHHHGGHGGIYISF